MACTIPQVSLKAPYIYRIENICSLVKENIDSQADSLLFFFIAHNNELKNHHTYHDFKVLQRRV